MVIKWLKYFKYQLINKYQKIDMWLIRFFSLTPLLSSIYFAFFNRRFYREHQTVLKARLAYEKSLANKGKSSYRLRRNIHRLEKGLIMRPRKPVFAENYIIETIDAFSKACYGNNFEDEQKWAHDVLQEYFTIVELTPIIMAAKKQFELTKINLSSETYAISEKYVPYQQGKLKKSSVNFEDFKVLCQQRRSIRWFKSQTVNMTSINNAIQLASLAPSACNRQAFEFRVFNNPEDASKIGSLAMGTEGIFHNFQSVIVILGDVAAYPNERDRHLIYIDASLAAMQFMLSLETLGLSSCPINWPDIEKRETAMAKLLNLSDYIRPVMLIALGYADEEGGVPFSQKKSVAQIASLSNLLVETGS